jgi:hypothetical protein
MFVRLNSSSSTSSLRYLDEASRNGGLKPSNPLKRTQNWVNTQQIIGAQIGGRDRRIASAHRSALYSMLDEASTMFPTIDISLAAGDLVDYNLEIEIDDDDV